MKKEYIFQAHFSTKNFVLNVERQKKRLNNKITKKKLMFFAPDLSHLAQKRSFFFAILCVDFFILSHIFILIFFGVA